MSGPADKDGKLAAALRANLRRRKAQQREREAMATGQAQPRADGREPPIEARPTPSDGQRKDP